MFRSLSTRTPRAPSRAGCTGSPRTCSSTRPAARAGSASTRSPTTPPTGSRARCRRPTRRTSNQMFDADIEAALAELPPDFRAAVVLCDVEGLTYEEIADVLELKMGTVRSRIHRGRAMLRKALAHRAPTAGRVRYAGPALSESLTVILGLSGHLGDRVSALVDGQLSRSGGGAGLGARADLPRLPPPGRARGLAQDPALRRWPTRPLRRRPGCSARCTTWTPGRPSTRSSAAPVAVASPSPRSAPDRSAPPCSDWSRSPAHRAGHGGARDRRVRHPPRSATTSPEPGCFAGSRRPAPCGVTQNRTRERRRARPRDAPDQRPEPTQPLSGGQPWASPSALRRTLPSPPPATAAASPAQPAPQPPPRPYQPPAPGLRQPYRADPPHPGYGGYAAADGAAPGRDRPEPARAGSPAGSGR